MAEKTKNEIMKMLLSSPNPPPKGVYKSRMDKFKSNDSDGEYGAKLSNYLQHLTGQPEFQNVVEMDHPYSRPWNWRPDNFFAKPAKKLFVFKNNNSWGNVENINVVDDTPPPAPAYDCQKAQMMMEETTRLITLLRSDPGDVEWEAKIERSDWSISQSRLFERIVRILHWERLNRLSYVSNWNEPVLRRISLDKSARRFRSAMASISWKPKLIHWLHNLLLEVLEVNYLVAYVDILQTLKKKVPALVERMISIPASSKINPDALKLLLKKPWDPAASGLSCYKPRRLPGNPLIVIVPPYGQNGSSEHSSKLQRWLPYLSQIGNAIPVTTNNVTSSKITAITSLEYMLSATRAKLSELKSDYAGRSIILFGLNSGSALACQVALVDQVAAVICLGFPLNTVEDKRGQPDDTLLNLSVPVLFVIGQHAATSYIDDIEELREKLNIETGLIIIGAADDHLRISKAKQKIEGITQGMVDHCIIDEVTDFIGNVLSAPSQPPPPPPVSVDNRPRLQLVEKKRKISIQDDIYPRKQLIPSGSIRQDGITLNITTVRRGGARGRGRTKYITHSTNGGVAISRRGGLSEKGITRPAIENISVINSSNIDSSETQTFKILPHIKVLGGEGFVSLTANQDNTSLVDELTPDRLLEMPIIIAPDNQDEGQDNQLKVMMSGNDTVRRRQTVAENGSTNKKNEVKCATIYLRKRGTTTTASGTRVSAISVGLTGNRQVIQRKPRLQNFPAAKYSEK